MSFTTSARLSRGRYTVAIAGATTDLGQTIAQTFLSSDSYGPFFSRVICLVDDPSSAIARNLADSGAHIHGASTLTSESGSPADLPSQALRIVLSGVDVLINALPSVISPLDVNVMFEAALDVCVPLYFPGGFALRNTNHTSNDHVHVIESRRSLRHHDKVDKMKVLEVYVGMFLEDYIQFASTNQTVTVTSRSDLARVLAELIILWGTGRTLPDEVHIAGSSRGEDDGQTGGNDNELVNPGEHCWKWET